MRRLLLLLTALLALVAACASDEGAVSTTVGDTTAPTTAPTTGAGVTTVPPTTTSSAAAPTAPDLSALDLAPEVKEQLADLIVAAQEIRGLSFLTPPKIAVVSDEELEARVREKVEEESEDFPADEALYKLLGLLSASADLEAILVDLYGEAVAGYYDGETGEIVVPARESGFSILQQGTLLHELVHALADQHHGMDAEYRAMIDEDRLDEALAYLSLVEGDAVLAMANWTQGLGEEDLGRFMAEAIQEQENDPMANAPQFIAASVVFPYETGFAFVKDLYDAGGWAAVDEAYALLPDLPGSTEQVITPDDYKLDLPTAVEAPPVTVEGYTLERTSVWGEFSFKVMFDQALAGSVSDEAVDGWGGDAYHQWFDGENAALLLVYRGDTERDLDEMEEMLTDYARRAVLEEDFAWVESKDGLLYFIAADETEVGEHIRSSVGLG